MPKISLSFVDASANEVWGCEEASIPYIILMRPDAQNIFSPELENQALFSCIQNSKTLQDSSSHRIFQHMHEVLNLHKIKN